MKKSENTLYQLENALQRILKKCTRRIPDHRKLSIRAVEEEAGLGNGSCYYYHAFTKRVQAEITQLKTSKQCIPSQSTTDFLQKRCKQEKKIKVRYREQVAEQKQKIAIMAAEHHQLAYALKVANARIIQLEKMLDRLQKNKITRIK